MEWIIFEEVKMSDKRVVVLSGKRFENLFTRENFLPKMTHNI